MCYYYPYVMLILVALNIKKVRAVPLGKTLTMH
jgi:hypothetical protein|nr:MAG TPA: hypothetical protein [Caudoviricetes sp.]